MDAYRLYLLIIATRRLGYAIGYTLFAIYLIRVVGTNPLELVLPGVAYEAAIFLFEIPTGVVADVYSRRLSVIIGYFLLGAGFIVAGLLPTLAIAVIGLSIMGLGSTFVSGALSAWIVDEVGQERAAQAFLRSAQIGMVATVGGIIVSMILGSINLQLTVIGGGVPLLVMAIVMLFIMPETGFQPVPAAQRQSWRDLFATLGTGFKSVRANRIVLWILVITFIVAGFGETFGKLWQAHILENFTLPSLGDFDDIIWFGIISGVFMPVTLLATEFVRRRVNLSDNNAVVRALMGLIIGMIASTLLFALSEVFILMLLGIWITRMLMTMITPLMDTWLNQHVQSNMRATVLSMVGQVNSLGEIIIGGPIAGVVATLLSVRITLALVALSLLPLTPIFRRTIQRPAATANLT